MQYLTPSLVQGVFDAHPDIQRSTWYKLFPPSVGYLIHIFTPFAQELGYANSQAQIISIIAKYHLSEKVIGLVEDMQGEELETIKRELVRYVLIAAIDQLVLDDTLTIKGPWEITGLLKSSGFIEPLAFFPGDHLPVTINLFSQKISYQHTWSRDVTLGIKAFLLYGPNPLQIELEMFGYSFPDQDSFDYIIDRYFPEDRLHKYRIHLGEVGTKARFSASGGIIPAGKEDTFTFDDPEFMQGYATAALWSQVDHHKYWSDLIEQAHPYIPLTF